MCELIYDNKTFSGHVNNQYFTNTPLNGSIFDNPLYISGFEVHDLFSFSAIIDDYLLTDNEFMPHNLLRACDFGDDICDIIEKYMDYNNVPYSDFYEFECMDRNF